MLRREALTLGQALVGQGNLTRMQVEIEAGEDSGQGGNGNEAVGDAGLEEKGEMQQVTLAVPSRWVKTISPIMYFQVKNT